MLTRIFALFLSLIQLATINNALTFYAWMVCFVFLSINLVRFQEKNSFVCQDNNSFDPSPFLSDEDAIQFNCEALCGNPLLTSQVIT